MFHHLKIAVVLVALPMSALATPLTISSSGVQGSDGNTWASVGDDYATTGVDASRNGSNVVLSFTTKFSGTDSVAGYNINYADIFFNNGLAISLGDQTANGGIARAGLYQVGSYLTSQQVWGGRPGVIYGQGYINNGIVSPAPTVLTGGSFIEGVSVTDVSLGAGFYDLSVSFKDVAALRSETGLFWGTGDCGNGGIYAVGAIDTPVPEPATFAVLAVGLLGLAALRRSKMPVTLMVPAEIDPRLAAH